MEQQIRFCTAPDGVRIAYARTGEGPPLVKAANWLNHLEYDWQSPVWRYLLEELSRDHLLIRYDERGNGLSDWDAEDISFEAFVQDLETVVEAAGLSRFALLGISQGCAVSIAYAVRHPERVTHLVLHGGYAKGWGERSTPEELQRQQALLTLMEQGWGQDNPAFRQLFTTLFMPGATTEQMDWFNELQRITASPENAVRIRKACGVIDVSALLPRVEAPTLVLHSRHDAVVPFEVGRRLATAIPGARFVPLESRNHLVLRQEPAWERFIAEIRGFLGAARPASAWSRVDALFDAALDQPEEARSAWLERACAGEPDLRAEVSRLLELAGERDDRLRPSAAASGPLWQEVMEELVEGAPATAGRGRYIGSYEIVGTLGRGGMGTVYRAKHPTLGREVAVKALSVGFTRDAAHLRRFEREAKLLASLNHPNIASIYDLLISEDKPYLILELVEGESLSERLARGPLDLEEAIGIARQLADAIEEAHKKGIIHRDLKPSNVKITGEGRVKVLDFGLAKSQARLAVTDTTASAAPADSATTLSGMVLGTPRYMSPEQAKGEKADERADVWAFGCLLFEMLSGVPAFRGDTASEAIASVLRDEVEWERLPNEMPEPLVGLVRRCLEKDPERRPRRIGEVRAELQSSLEAASRRRTWKYIVGVALLLVLVLVLFWLGW